MLKKTFSFLVLYVLFSFKGFAHHKINHVNNIAIEGYDVVAYFLQEKAVRGSERFKSTYKNVGWLFHSLKHKEIFEQDPEKYIPQYGGFCAYGTSRGYLVKIDPYAWTVYKGKLYLNFSLSVRETWSKDKDLYIERADKHWPNL